MLPSHRSAEAVMPGSVTVIGIPFDTNSSFMRGAALAPAGIREVLLSGASNWCCENGIDLSRSPMFCYGRDLEIESNDNAFLQIEAIASSVLNQGGYLVSLGGDHSVTFPLIKAYAKHHPGLNILHLDAHPDLYDQYNENRFSHACPFARIMEAGLVARLVQMGIRATTTEQRDQAEKFGVEMVEMQQWELATAIRFDGPIYLSLDMDVFDPAYAPGVSHHEPGGLSIRDVLTLLQNLKGDIVGADIVEYNPRRDANGMTAMAAAKMLKEIAGKMILTHGATMPSAEGGLGATLSGKKGL